MIEYPKSMLYYINTIVKILTILLIANSAIYSQNIKFDKGSYIINMGIVPQKVSNGLKPYGLVYDLLENFGIPIYWVINPNKVKDGVDFSHELIDYRGSAFIILEEFRTQNVDQRISYWQSLGVQGSTISKSLDIPTAYIQKISTAPNWTLDKQSGDILVEYFSNAGIPASAYGGSSSNWKNPSQLTDCDAVFGLPHADPKWSTHQKLLSWNSEQKGAIWTGCHSGSAIELMFDPSNKSQQTNFLSNKIGNAGGNGPYSNPNNSLIEWGDHDDGTPPYNYSDPTHPIMQFIGIMDNATTNGSEQIYIPVQQSGAGWRNSTTLGVFDPNHPESTLSGAAFDAAVLVYGHGFGNDNNGWVMYHAAHDHAKSNASSNVAAQRTFFNFSLLAARTKAPDPEIITDVKDVIAGESDTYSFIINGNRTLSEFSIQWSSSCGGTFSPSNAQITTFTGPQVSQNTKCLVTVTLTDACNRVYKASDALNIKCATQVETTIVNPCGNNNTGSIEMSLAGATGPYNWSYTTKNPTTGPVNGTGSIISNLIAADYDVTVSPAFGCSKKFKVTLKASPAIDLLGAVTNLNCSTGSTGGISVSANGGIPPYTYDWFDLPGTENPSVRNNLGAGTYFLTVTDDNDCTENAAFTVAMPSALVITPSPTHVLCHGDNTGAISLNVSGGTPNFTYAWSDGASTKDRTNLTAGSYSVTVTDSNGCTSISSGINVIQPAAPLALSATMSNVSCNGADDGWIKVTPSGGTTEYSLLWSNATTKDSIGGLSGGTYTVTVTDMNNCTAVLTKEITEVPALNLSLVVNNASCPGDTDGSIILTVTGGTPTYDWSNDGPDTPDDDAKDLINVAAGTYTVTVTDATGCTAVASGTIINTSSTPAKPSTIKH